MAPAGWRVKGADVVRVHLVLTLCLLGSAVQPSLQACGGKFLVLNRGTRFERPSAAHQPANVLIYAPASSGLPRALATLPVLRTLERAGYTTTTVSRPEELAAALARGDVDLVLVDLVDAPTLDAHLAGPSAPALLPVVFTQSRDDIKRATDRYQCVVGKPKSTQSFLEAIDEALTQRRARRP